jgi:carbonic anhydrase
MCATCRHQACGLNACPTRRQALRVFGASAIGLAFVGNGWTKEIQAPPKPQNVLSPDASLQRLMKGNERYVAGETKRHDFKHEREALAGGQNPYAGILSCADSRIAPEYAFDSGRGDLFVCRVAGGRRGRAKCDRQTCVGPAVKTEERRAGE